MNPRMSTCRGLVPLLLFASLAAQNKDPDPGLIEPTIARLADADPKVADAAMIALIRDDRASVPVLQAVLAKKPEPAAAERAERALRICQIDAPVENGVKVGLAVDLERLWPEDEANLTTTVCNLTDAPIALFLGTTVLGNVLHNGLAFTQQDEPGVEPGRPVFPVVSFGHCGTFARPIVVVVQPWSTLSFEARIVAPVQSQLPRAVPQPAGRKVTLQVQHEVVADQARGLVNHGPKPDWNGMLRSNAVVIEFVAGVRPDSPSEPDRILRVHDRPRR